MNPLVVWVNADRYHIVSTVGVLAFGVSRAEAEAALKKGGFDTSILDKPLADPLVFKATLQQAFASEIASLNDAVDRIPVDVGDVRQRQSALQSQLNDLQQQLDDDRRRAAIRDEINHLMSAMHESVPSVLQSLGKGHTSTDAWFVLWGTHTGMRIRQLRGMLQ